MGSIFWPNSMRHVFSTSMKTFSRHFGGNLQLTKGTLAARSSFSDELDEAELPLDDVPKSMGASRRAGKPEVLGIERLAKNHVLRCLFLERPCFGAFDRDQTLPGRMSPSMQVRLPCWATMRWIATGGLTIPSDQAKGCRKRHAGNSFGPSCSRSGHARQGPWLLPVHGRLAAHVASVR